MSRPVCLDLFCGAGGASMGLYRAGFDVVGVDIKPQPHYPALHDAEYASHFKFIQADAMTFPLEGYDCYWASPPCQFASQATLQWRKVREYPDLIGDTRDRLKWTTRPYIIENVPEAHLLSPIILNGAIFGLKVRRRRAFECSFHVPERFLVRDGKSYFRTGRPVRDGDVITPVGHFSNVPYARKAMEIDWMNQKELTQAIPPAYSEYLGKYIVAALAGKRE